MEECKEGPAYLFQMQLHLSEHEPDLQVSGFFKKKKRFTKLVHLRSAKPNGNSMVIPRLQSQAGQPLPMRQMLSLEVLSHFVG